MNLAPPEPIALQSAAEPRYVRVGLIVAATISAAASVQLLVWPRLPQAAPPPARLPGWEAVGERPGYTDRQSSLGLTRRFQATTSSGASLELQLTTLAQTADSGLEVAAFTIKEPALAMQQRRLVRLDPADSPYRGRKPRPRGTAPGGRASQALPPLREVALGQVAAQPALQTCLTPLGYAVTATGSQSLLFRKATTLQERWQYLLRSWPPQPHSCLLVTLRGPVSHDELLATWGTLRAPLQSLGLP
ncbi:MAG: hypothetical protein VKO00_08215 [Cyanobacteriota bacterium]|nr:hypothetical protein [Cyanobacteriota bacterium]